MPPRGKRTAHARTPQSSDRTNKKGGTRKPQRTNARSRGTDAVALQTPRGAAPSNGDGYPRSPYAVGENFAARPVVPRNQEFATVSEDKRDLFPKPPAGVSTADATARPPPCRRQFLAPAAPLLAPRAAAAPMTDAPRGPQADDESDEGMPPAEAAGAAASSDSEIGDAPPPADDADADAEMASASDAPEIIECTKGCGRKFDSSVGEQIHAKKCDGVKPEAPLPLTKDATPLERFNHELATLLSMYASSTTLTNHVKRSLSPYEATNKQKGGWRARATRLRKYLADPTNAPKNTAFRPPKPVVIWFVEDSAKKYHFGSINAAYDSKKPDFGCSIGALNDIAQGKKTVMSGRIGGRFATEADLKDDTIIKIDYAGRVVWRGRPAGFAATALQRDQGAATADDRKREAREAETAAADARVEDSWAERVYGPGASDDMVSV